MGIKHYKKSSDIENGNIVYLCDGDRYAVNGSEINCEDELDLISDSAGYCAIEVLSKGVYSIPTYQRGYRWENEHVQKFLEDIFEKKHFSNFNKEIDWREVDSSISKMTEHIKDDKTVKQEFKYCIQPLVVMRKKRLNEYDVLDGQQRLTTTYIILSSLKLCSQKYNYGQSLTKEKYKVFDDIPIKIKYESRNKSKELLESLWKLDNYSDLDGLLAKENNIDFDHMINSFKVSYEFFDNELSKIDYESEVRESYVYYMWCVIMQCTEFIWYVVDAQQEGKIDERKIFANFNSGKLQLTNSELIKAVFMNPANYGVGLVDDTIKDRQIVISEKWDEIENMLHNPDFWAFVPHPEQYSDVSKNDFTDTRIDIIFEFLTMDTELKHIDGGAGEYKIFNIIDKWISTKLKETRNNADKRNVMDRCWAKIEMIYSNIKEIYEDDGRNSDDRKLYNLMGFYIYVKSIQRDNDSLYNGHITRQGNINPSRKNAYKEIYNVMKCIFLENRNKRRNILINKICKLLDMDIPDENSGDWNEIVQAYISDIEYGKRNADKIASVLLLYNIALLDNSSGIGNRFHFLEYAQNAWEREHIFAENEDYLEADCWEAKRDERIASLKSLSKGIDIEDTTDISTLHKNGNLKYVNYRYCRDKNDLTAISGNNSITDLRDLPNNNNGYERDLAKAITVGIKAGEMLRNFRWINEAENILQYNFNELKPDLIIRIINYIADNKEFYNHLRITFNYFERDGNLEKHLSKDGTNLRFDKISEVYKCISDEFGNIAYKPTIFLETSSNPQPQSNGKIFSDEDDFKNWFNNKGDSQQSPKETLERGIIDAIKNAINDPSGQKGIFYNVDISSSNDICISAVKDNISLIKTAIVGNMDYMKNEINKFFLAKKNVESVSVIPEPVYTFYMNDNSMGNMTLLPYELNNIVSNSPYAKKCKIIYDNYKSGKFIPMGTMFVFTDLYTKGLNAATQWLPENRLEYMEDQVKTLVSFFEKGEN